LGRIEPAHGISAMNSINSTILRSLFMPFFIGTTVVSAVLAAIGLLHSSEPGAAAMVGGGLIYVVGMFACTIFLNVPLNNSLVFLTPAGAHAVLVWARFLKDWTFWNHVRTISSTAACALYIVAIAAK